MRKDLIIYVFYLALFGLLFLQFPLSGSLPGKVDNWYIISVTSNYAHLISAIFTGSEASTFLYPEINGFIFGNPAIGFTLFYMPIKLFIANDIWAYYVLISIIFSLNAFLLYKTYILWFKDRTTMAILGGLMFTSTNFLFAHFDSPETQAIFLPLAFFYLLSKYLKNGSLPTLYFSFFIGGLTIYLSGYNFLLQYMLTGTLLFSAFRSFKGRSGIHLIGAMALQLLVISPFIWFYVINSKMLGAINPAEGLEKLDGMALYFTDLIRYLPNNLLYRSDCDGFAYWLCHIHSSGIGYSIFGLAIIGLFPRFKSKVLFLCISIIGILVAVGPFINLGGHTINMPLFYVFKFTPLEAFLRIPIRAYWIFCFGISFFAMNGLIYLKEKTHTIIPLMIICFYFIENVPLPFEKFNSQQFLTTPAISYYSEYGKHRNVAHLPSSLFSRDKQQQKLPVNNNYNPEDEYLRELIYAYWQGKYNYNIINGMSSYFPQSRIDNQLLIDGIQSEENQLDLIKKNNLDAVYFFKDMCFFKEEESILQTLESSSVLVNIYEDEGIAVFEPVMENSIIK